MKILMVHNKYKLPGGEDESTRQEIELLKRGGDWVDVLYVDNHDISNKKIISTAINSIFSLGNLVRLTLLLRRGGYDVMHVQNYFPKLSMSIFVASKVARVPSVHTVRNFRYTCANGYLLREGQICELCLKKKGFFDSIVHKCYRGSIFGSIVVAAMLSFNKLFNLYNNIDTVIALSEFTKRKLIEYGIDHERLYVKPNFIIDPPMANYTPDMDYIFVGRISQEKGISELLSIWPENSERHLTVVGDGPLLLEMKQKYKNRDNVRFLGHVKSEDVISLISRHKALIFPSKWYEGMPRTIIESLASGTPVICKSIGTMDSMIEDGVTGFKYQKIEGVLNILDEFDKSEERNHSMRLKCRKDFEEKYTEEENYKILKSIYSRAIV